MAEKATKADEKKTLIIIPNTGIAPKNAATILTANPMAKSTRNSVKVSER
ncbi:MAG: hypothetical protein GXO99_06515, partial [Nitrospirae bacterium]|nr:hypothetical protein [Nitrospirota bacterium]